MEQIYDIRYNTLKKQWIPGQARNDENTAKCHNANFETVCYSGADDSWSDRIEQFFDQIFFISGSVENFALKLV